MVIYLKIYIPLTPITLHYFLIKAVWCFEVHVYKIYAKDGHLVYKLVLALLISLISFECTKKCIHQWTEAFVRFTLRKRHNSHSLADPLDSVFYSCFPHRLRVNVQMMLCSVIQLQTKIPEINQVLFIYTCV